MGWLKFALNMDIVSRQRINILIHLAEIQSTSASPALNLIQRVADECKFPKNELEALISSPEPIGSFGALSESQKKLYMHNICELMALIHIDQHKKLLCQQMAYNLDYDSNQLNVIVERFQNKDQLQFG